jgi:hypothetical protein
MGAIPVWRPVMRSFSALFAATTTTALLLSTPACSDDATPNVSVAVAVDASDANATDDAGLTPDASADLSEPDATPEPDAAEDAAQDSASDATVDTIAEDAPEQDAADTPSDDVADVDTTSDARDTDVLVDADTIEDDTSSPIWEPPATAAEYPFATPGSLISALRFAAPGEGLSVDDDGTPDNNLGDLLRSLEGLLSIDIDELLTENIDSGLLTIGLAWVGESPIEEGARSEVHILQLNDVDNSPATRDVYYVEPSSFEPGSGAPTARFPGETSGGVFESGRSSFDLTVPTGLFELDLSVQQAVVQASPMFDLLGVAVDTGRIAGVVPGENVFAALNGYVASPQCSCVDAAGPLFAVGDEGRASCDTPDTDACVSGDPCAQISSLCAIVVQLVTNSYDQDTGGDPAADGMSVNLVFDAVGITLVGLAP